MNRRFFFLVFKYSAEARSHDVLFYHFDMCVWKWNKKNGSTALILVIAANFIVRSVSKFYVCVWVIKIGRWVWVHLEKSQKTKTATECSFFSQNLEEFCWFCICKIISINIKSENIRKHTQLAYIAEMKQRKDPKSWIYVFSKIWNKIARKKQLFTVSQSTEKFRR